MKNSPESDMSGRQLTSQTGRGDIQTTHQSQRGQEDTQTNHQKVGQVRKKTHKSDRSVKRKNSPESGRSGRHTVNSPETQVRKTTHQCQTGKEKHRQFTRQTRGTCKEKRQRRQTTDTEDRRLATKELDNRHRTQKIGNKGIRQQTQNTED